MTPAQRKVEDIKKGLRKEVRLKEVTAYLALVAANGNGMVLDTNSVYTLGDSSDDFEALLAQDPAKMKKTAMMK